MYMRMCVNLPGFIKYINLCPRSSQYGGSSVLSQFVCRNPLSVQAQRTVSSELGWRCTFPLRSQAVVLESNCTSVTSVRTSSVVVVIVV